ncbi:MAG: hypothetical protein KUG81_08990 [Gammaproteobacteria bacterium]|nr:hypothetical protein [Gammaproteobacteria bacterium]
MIKSGKAITPDNVIDEAAKYTDQEIDSMSKNILLSKVTQVYEKLGVEVNKADE